MSAPNKNFYIFRHGECPFNVSGHIQGQKFNGSLTLKGREQARRTGEILAGRNIEIIVSSPMKRALQTAKIVAQRINAPILIDRRFIEVNMGVAEGMHITLAEKNFAELYRHWRSNSPDDSGTRFEKGESKAEVRKRLFEGLNYYAEQTPYTNIGISGHGITISQALLSLGICRNNIPNGSVLHLLHDETGWKYGEFLKN